MQGANPIGSPLLFQKPFFRTLLATRFGRPPQFVWLAEQ